MLKKPLVAVAALILSAGTAWAEEGTFDRTAEVARYSQVFETKTRSGIIDACLLIENSGISDESLAAIIAARLIRDYGTDAGKGKSGETYVLRLVKALASQGIEAYASTIATVDSSWRRGGCATCKAELARIPSYRARNMVMASRVNHVEGASPRSSMLLNLLLSDDVSHRAFAADRMNWERVLDARLMKTIAVQLDDYLAGNWPIPIFDREHVLSLYVKLLGYSGNVQYRDVLQRMAASTVSPPVKLHAQKALQRMKQ